jgi:SAM-dependent methyltransferase
MNAPSDGRAADFYVQSYDESVPDWPGEIEFYRGLAAEVRRRGEGLLEVACGTGRVAIRLAQDGTRTVGLDLSLKMLAVAREKSRGVDTVTWVQGDMRAFDLSETFALVLIPGHAFQNLNSPDDQVACLRCIRRHLKPGGQLVAHLDHQGIENFGWLAGLVGGKAGIFELDGEFQHAATGQQIKMSRAWTYEPATQTATCTTAWEAIGADGQVVDRWQNEPSRLHCVFPFEMEHVLARAGFTRAHVYGDFQLNPLEDHSPSMIWIADRPESGEVPP